MPAGHLNGVHMQRLKLTSFPGASCTKISMGKHLNLSQNDGCLRRQRLTVDDLTVITSR
jgi:hypothetical protein